MAPGMRGVTRDPTVRGLMARLGRACRDTGRRAIEWTMRASTALPLGPLPGLERSTLERPVCARHGGGRHASVTRDADGFAPVVHEDRFPCGFAGCGEPRLAGSLGAWDEDGMAAIDRSRRDQRVRRPSSRSRGDATCRFELTGRAADRKECQ